MVERVVATPEALATAIARCRDLTPYPFGVHLSTHRIDQPPLVEACLDIAIAGGAALLETTGDCPRAWIEKSKRHGVRVLHWCSSLRDALAAERKGVDAVGIDRVDGEARGGEDPRGDQMLIGLAVRTLRIPVVVAGGRTLADALALGAQGVEVAGDHRHGGVQPQALGLQQTPPNQVLVGLSLFLTFFIMGPTLEKVYNDAYKPYSEQKMQFEEAVAKGADPLRTFMLKQTRAADLALFNRIDRKSVV